MKYLSSFLFLLLTVAVSLQAETRMTIRNNNFDFGYMPQQATVSYEFWLISTGDDSLRIKDVKPDCACTKVPLIKDIVSPGDSTGLEIIFSSKLYLKKVKKSVGIISNATPRVDHIKFRAFVIKNVDLLYPLNFKPFMLNLTQFTKKINDKATFQITNSSSEKLNIEIIYSPDDYFELSIPASIEAGETVKAELKIKVEKLKESFKKSFTFEVNDKKKSRFTIPVEREVRLFDEE